MLEIKYESKYDSILFTFDTEWETRYFEKLDDDRTLFYTWDDVINKVSINNTDNGVKLAGLPKKQMIGKILLALDIEVLEGE